MNPAAKTGNRLWAGMFLLVLVLSQDAWLFWDPDVLLGPWNLALRVFLFPRPAVPAGSAAVA